MTREQIIAIFGADTKAFDAAIRGMKVRVTNFARESMRSLATHFAAPLSIGGLVFASKQITDFADNLKRTAEGLGVTTDFLQDFFAAARQSGSNDRTAEKGISKLSQFIGEANEEGGEAAEKFSRWGIALENANGTARTTEEILRAVADKMRDTTNGAERAAMAVDLFGKAGVELIPTLMGGSAAIDEFGQKVNKLSEFDIKQIDEARDSIDELGRSALVTGGKLVAGLMGAWAKLKGRGRPELSDVFSLLTISQNPFDFIFSSGEKDFDSSPLSKPEALEKRSTADKASIAKAIAKQATEQAKAFKERQDAEKQLSDMQESTADRVNRLRREAEQLESDINADKFEGLENDKKQAELAKSKVELKKAELALSKEQLDREKQITSAMQRFKDSRARFQEQQQERFGMTIGQLADMPILGFQRGLNFIGTDEFGGAKIMAQQIEAERQMAQNAMQAGDIGWFRQHTQNADSITRQLNETFPGLLKQSELQSIDGNLKEMAEAFQTLVGQIFGPGLPIIPKNGE